MMILTCPVPVDYGAVRPEHQNRWKVRRLALMIPDIFGCKGIGELLLAAKP